MLNSFRSNGQVITLGDEHLIGSGGEADVFGYGDTAFKVYRDLALAPRVKAAAKLRSFPPNLTQAVVAPKSLLFSIDEPGEVVGFAMPRVRGAFPWHRLLRRSWRVGRVSTGDMMSLFAELYAALVDLHSSGVVVGDLNDSNILFTTQGGSRIHLIDADSMQFGAFGCPVGHPRYVPPELFGVDFAAEPAFSPATDWYAFMTLLFEGLMHMHPYGGVHPSVRTLRERAVARICALNDAVVRPKVAADPLTLPPALLSLFRGTFERGERGVPPQDIFAHLWRRCSHCGSEHAAASCHRCAPKVDSLQLSSQLPGSGHLGQPTHSKVSVRTVRSGGVFRRLIVENADAVIAATSVGGRLRYLLSRGAALIREDGRTVVDGPPPPGLVVGLAHKATWLGSGARLIEIPSHADNGVGAARGSASASSAHGNRAVSSTFDGETAFALVGLEPIRLDGDRVVVHRTGVNLGTVLAGQTWLGGGSSNGLVVQRVGRRLIASSFSPQRPGLRPLAIPCQTGITSGRIRHIHGHGTGRFVLLDLAFAGTRSQPGTRHLMVFDAAGALVAHLTPDLASAGGACLAGRYLFWPTDQGICAHEIPATNGGPQRTTTLSDTAPFVSAAHSLLPGPAGSLYVVSDHAIAQLRLGGA